MCPPVSPHKGASIVQSPVHHAYVFGMETLLRGRAGGRAGAAPTVSFGWIACGRLVSFGMDCAWAVDVVWVNYARGRLMLFGWITHGRLVSFGWIAREWLFC